MAGLAVPPAGRWHPRRVEDRGSHEQGERRPPTIDERTNPVMSLATLALGLAFFGLFYALVIACDHL
jgi:hypothetical protein